MAEGEEQVAAIEALLPAGARHGVPLRPPPPERGDIARCIAIIVGSPALLAPACRSIEQMRLANGLCRFRELAKEILAVPLPVLVGQAH